MCFNILILTVRTFRVIKPGGTAPFGFIRTQGLKEPSLCDDMTSSPASSPAGFIPEIAVDNTLGAWLIGLPILARISERPKASEDMGETSYYYVVTLFWDPVFVFTSPPVWSAQLLPLGGTFVLDEIFKAVSVSEVSSHCDYGAQILLELFEFSWLITAGSIIQMTADVTTTGSLIYVLRHLRTGFNSRTDSKLDLLIAYAFSTVSFTFSMSSPLNSRRALGIMDDEDGSTAFSSSNRQSTARFTNPRLSRSARGTTSHPPMELKILQRAPSGVHTDMESSEKPSMTISPDDLVNVA
ncbi:hypothetical protein DICSQDRAFT_127778 [Dichomitus squalens LYAD-421 SS1]|uniref:Uncharacterized protein n=1 Tax=Dichomitus squalens (strain LYAD-421) TaxID=732165 RepID=R7SVQ6_DICSQ|nr:uncharacterized protein DICSQDRAFT_127778 [Dichomitus squalens LYAD-421 SS1]EJF60269.1 hypothetical protein DICSQDRAFT_127778 [Dichomitus squalens LYAD-421 SS1]